MKAAIDIDVAVVSDTGLVRGHNEDSTGADLVHELLIVADGMGGYRAGEVASAIAVTATVRSYRSGLRGLVDIIADENPELRHISAQGQVLRDALENANALIFETARDQPEYQGMGTTIVGLGFHEGVVTVGHVGDSRAYRYREQKLEQLTNDHTVRQELVDRGLYTREEANEAISRNLVTRALGVDAQVQVDICEHKTAEGDLYILCSDGLNDMIDDDRVFKLIQDHQQNLDVLANALVHAANDAGGEDNISVLVARVGAGPGVADTWRGRIKGWFAS